MTRLPHAVTGLRARAMLMASSMTILALLLEAGRKWH